MPRWEKGCSGNPGGRPAGHGDLREIARRHTESALGVLVDVMQDESAPAAARVAACVHLLDRGYGRPESRARIELTSVDLGDRLRRAQERVYAGIAERVPDASVARLVASEQAGSTGAAPGLATLAAAGSATS
jgi:hypothetical protein